MYLSLLKFYKDMIENIILSGYDLYANAYFWEYDWKERTWKESSYILYLFYRYGVQFLIKFFK